MRRIALKYGLWMFAGFTVFFLLMHLSGLSQRYDLRILNGLIHIGFIVLAIRTFRKEHSELDTNYLYGVAMGMYTSAVGVIGFCIFMLLFLAFNR